MTAGTTRSASVEQEDNVNMEHLGHKAREKLINPQGSGGPVLEYEDPFIENTL